MAYHNEYENEANEVIKECLEKLNQKDSIMEQSFSSTLKRYMEANGDLEEARHVVVNNYEAIAQTANMLAEWLLFTNISLDEVNATVVDNLKNMIIKNFDPKKADSIFSDESSGTPGWLTDLIIHPPWRKLIYKLAEDYPECLMLTFTVKLISDAGHQSEITSISTASQQLEVFTSILKNQITCFLTDGTDMLEGSNTEQLATFTKLVCHGEHTFLYSQVLMHLLSLEPKGGSLIKRLFQEIARYAQQEGHDGTPILLSLMGMSGHPRVAQALTAMLAKNALNPADITILYKTYQQSVDPPPVEFLRIPQFLDLLLDALFKPGSKLHAEHRYKYVYLLAYAASVHETYKKSTNFAAYNNTSYRKSINKDELDSTLQAIEKVSMMCAERKGSSELLPELNNIFSLIKSYQIVAYGIVYWVKHVVSEPSYFKKNTEQTPLHFALLDEVTACHTTLHSKVLNLYINVFEAQYDELEVLLHLEMKKMIIDRMVHLLSMNCVVPVINYIKQCWQSGDTDISLIRYFVTEVLTMISPPYSEEFMELFLPLVECEEIAGKIPRENDSAVNEFIAIRREDQSVWERRAPLGPMHVRELVKRGIKVLVQPSNRRAYPIQSYVQAGAEIKEDISDAPVIIGVKQVPVDSLLPNKTYAFFSHTIKAQDDNMPLLDAILDRNIRLIDYEKLVDQNNARLVAFGKYAGYAGMINIMHGLGLRLLALGHHTPFMHVGPAHNYRDSGHAKQAIRACGYEIALSMMPRSIGPIVFVFTGSGNVSQGAQEIFQELPFEYVDPKDLLVVSELGQTTKVYGTIVSRSDHWVHKDGKPYNSEEADQHPERYYSNFSTHVAPYASVIINGIYWSPNSPKLLTIPDAKRLLQPQFAPWLPTAVGSPPLPHRLLAICDISADPGGSIEFMTDCTTIDNPFCLYDADYNQQTSSFAGPGVLVCSIDNMPTQLPLEATQSFGDLLRPYIWDIIHSNADEPFEQWESGQVVKGATIASNGDLTPSFKYIMDLRDQKEKSRSGKRSENSRTVLVLGAGYVASPLVEYLSRDKDIHVIVGSDLQGNTVARNARHQNAEAMVLDVIKNQDVFESLVKESDLVVSLLPYHLHPHVAKACIQFKRNMVTASYVTSEMKELHKAAQDAGITIMNEVGLDPGIDHLLALECFDQIKSNGGKITSFISYCGGLPAPENADNPLHYKFSWNPRGVILNSLGSARWLENNEICEIPEGGSLMDNPRKIDFLQGFSLEGFPNRDSLNYKEAYGISNVHTLLRGTLRYKGFCNAMKGLHMMDLLNPKPHPLLHPNGPDITWRQFMANLLAQPQDLLRTNVKNIVYEKVGRDEQRVKTFEDLGLFGEEEIAKKNTPLDTFVHYLQNKLMYQTGERDLVILRHEIGVQWPDMSKEQRNIDLVVYGELDGYSAMAKTVGYPAGIASNMVLNGEIQDKGVVGPTSINIFNTMIKRLQLEGIRAVETTTKY